MKRRGTGYVKRYPGRCAAPGLGRIRGYSWHAYDSRRDPLCRRSEVTDRLSLRPVTRSGLETLRLPRPLLRLRTRLDSTIPSSRRHASRFPTFWIAANVERVVFRIRIRPSFVAHCATGCPLTPSNFPNCACVRPRRVRSFWNLFEVGRSLTAFSVAASV